MDEITIVECSSFEDFIEKVKADRPQELVIADDPVNLKLGWSSGKTWWKLSLNNLRKSACYGKFDWFFESDQGRKEFVQFIRVQLSNNQSNT